MQKGVGAGVNVKRKKNDFTLRLTKISILKGHLLLSKRNVIFIFRNGRT
jgi:hypothetical protein